MSNSKKQKEISISGQVEEILIESASEPFNAHEAIETLINSSNILIFMNGNSDKPRCSKSAQALAILNQLNVNYCTFDVLLNAKIKEALKTYSNFETYPQIFINGKFIGNHDSVFDLYQSGQLLNLIAA